MPLVASRPGQQVVPATPRRVGRSDGGGSLALTPDAERRSSAAGSRGRGAASPTSLIRAAGLLQRLVRASPGRSGGRGGLARGRGFGCSGEPLEQLAQLLWLGGLEQVQVEAGLLAAAAVLP